MSARATTTTVTHGWGVAGAIAGVFVAIATHDLLYADVASWRRPLMWLIWPASCALYGYYVGMVASDRAHKRKGKDATGRRYWLYYLAPLMIIVICIGLASLAD